MTQAVEERILEMLRDTGIEKDGYSIEGISFLMEWNGYDVYRFHLNNDKPLKIGTPWFYLVKGDEITETDIDQTFEIMGKMNGGTSWSDEDWEDDDEESISEPVPCMMSCAGPRI